MRKIDVMSIEFINAVIEGQPFKDLSGDAKALYLSLFVLDRKEHEFTKEQLLRHVRLLDHSISTLDELFQRGFFRNRTNGTVTLNDDYYRYPPERTKKYDVTVTLKDVYIADGEESDLIKVLENAVSNNNKDLDWTFEQKKI